MHSFCVFWLLLSGMCFAINFEASPRIITEKSDNSIAEKFFYIYRSNMPVAYLIDMTIGAHQDALKFYQDIKHLGLNTIMLEFFLMKFNTTGILNCQKRTANCYQCISGTTPILASSQKSAIIFEKLLQWSDEMAFQTIGFENSSGSAMFFSVLQAIYQLPYNSGILIFTTRSALDEDFAALALQEATKKRIRVSGAANKFF